MYIGFANIGILVEPPRGYDNPHTLAIRSRVHVPVTSREHRGKPISACPVFLYSQENQGATQPTALIEVEVTSE